MTTPKTDGKTASSKPRARMTPRRTLLIAAGIVAGSALAALLVVVFALAMAYPNLPALDTLTDYRPKMPLRIFSADGVLIGEFGEERRNMVRINDIPVVMKKAVLAIEDDRFYQHNGVDYTGIVRAALHNATGGARQALHHHPAGGAQLLPVERADPQAQGL
jgi:penicillin-binding protein 1A